MGSVASPLALFGDAPIPILLGPGALPGALPK